VTGGSQGSEFINQNVPIALNALNIPLEVRHQSGNGKSEGVKELYSSNISVEVEEFYDSPHDEILWSDFIISRSRSTISSGGYIFKKRIGDYSFAFSYR
jgi:UDP-N-acetylglucosamine--N-acetylmuramyl-(pentapeptide) pyrophosphoryl-undecaprenol N-acetylglucosamine transferase